MKKKIKCNKKCKQKNKKAFTLVEIIAVIVIIGILSSIAIIAVTGYISKTKKNVLISHENGMKTAGKNMTSTYLSENKYCADANNKNCPVPKDNSREIVTLGQLIEEGYEQELKNPYYREGTDEKERYCYRDISIVQIKNIGNQNYEYKSCIICGNHIGVGCNNLYDGLNKYKECRKTKTKDECKGLLKLKEEDEDDIDENYQPGTNKCEKGKVCPKVQCEVEIENDKWTNKDVETAVRCVDELGGERCKRELYSKKFEAKPGSYKLIEKIKVYDRKGRATTCDVKVMQDVRNPYLSLGMNNGKVQITYLKDNESGIASWGLGDSDTPNYNQLSQIEPKDGINLIYGYAKDNAGNELNRDRGWRPYNSGHGGHSGGGSSGSGGGYHGGGSKYNYYPHNGNNNNYCNGSPCRNPYQTTHDRKPPELKPEDIYYGYKIYAHDQKLTIDKNACRQVGYLPNQYDDDDDNGDEGCNIKKGYRGTEHWTIKDPLLGIMGSENISDFTDVKLIALELHDNSVSSEYTFTINGETFTRSISNGGRRVLLRFAQVKDINSLRINGNISNIKNIYVYTRSNEKPVRGHRIFTRNPVQLYFDAKDDISGIKEVESVADGQKQVSYEKYRSVYNNGTVTVKVVDNSGNRVEQTITVNNIVKTPPTCQITIKGNNSNVKWWFNSDVYVTMKHSSVTGIREISDTPNDISNSYVDVAPNKLYSQIHWSKRNTGENVAAIKDYDDFRKIEQVSDKVFKMTKETALDPYNDIKNNNYSTWTKPYGVVYDLAGNMNVCTYDEHSISNAHNISTEGKKTMKDYGVLIDKTNPVCTFEIVRDRVPTLSKEEERDYLNNESNWNFNYLDNWMTKKDIDKFKVLSMETLSNVNKIAINDGRKPQYSKFIMQSHDIIWIEKGKTGGKHSELTTRVTRFMKLQQKDKSSENKTLRIWMMDAAGNVGGCSLEYKIDTEPPHQTERSERSECETKDGSTYYKVCEFQDDESGLVGSANGESVSKKRYCDPDGGACYRARDKAGNEEFCQKPKKSCKCVNPGCK